MLPGIQSVSYRMDSPLVPYGKQQFLVRHLNGCFRNCVHRSLCSVPAQKRLRPYGMLGLSLQSHTAGIEAQNSRHFSPVIHSICLSFLLDCQSRIYNTLLKKPAARILFICRSKCRRHIQLWYETADLAKHSPGNPDTLLRMPPVKIVLRFSLFPWSRFLLPQCQIHPLLTQEPFSVP